MGMPFPGGSAASRSWTPRLSGVDPSRPGLFSKLKRPKPRRRSAGWAPWGQGPGRQAIRRSRSTGTRPGGHRSAPAPWSRQVGPGGAVVGGSGHPGPGQPGPAARLDGATDLLLPRHHSGGRKLSSAPVFPAGGSAAPGPGRGPGAGRQLGGAGAGVAPPRRRGLHSRRGKAGMGKLPGALPGWRSAN